MAKAKAVVVQEASLSNIKYWIPTGIAPLDYGIGGGIPSGRIIEVYGNESVAKTSIALEFAKSFCEYHKAQKNPYKVLYVETEAALDKLRTKAMGVPVEEFEFYESQVLEPIFEKMLEVLKVCEASGTTCFIVLDTLAAAKCAVEFDEKNKYAGGMMLKPRVINDNLARLVRPLSATNSILCLPNQAYAGQKGGLIAKGGMGPKYYSSIRMELSKGFNYKSLTATGEEVSLGIGVVIKTVKNKVFLPQQEVTLILRGERGVDKIETLVFFLTQKELITLAGSWKKIKYKDKEITFQSAKKLKELIVTDPGILDYLNFLVLQYFASFSQLMKIRFIEDIWRNEDLFMGGKKTKLTEEEILIYDYSKTM